jgi:hypothetical protein
MPDDRHHQVRGRERHVDRHGERRVDGVLRVDSERVAEPLEEETPHQTEHSHGREVSDGADAVDPEEHRIDHEDRHDGGAGPSNAMIVVCTTRLADLRSRRALTTATSASTVTTVSATTRL